MKELEFKNNSGDVVEKYSKIADWTPTPEQLKNEKWYPTITIPVMVYMDRAELGDGEENVTLEMKEDEVPTSYKTTHQHPQSLL